MERFNEEYEEIQMQTKRSVVQLATIWTRVFDEETCQNHLQKLIQHVKMFFNDLKEESLEKLENVESQIRELHAEAENLQRLLKIQIDLPQPSRTDTPLLMIQSQLDQSLINLRDMLRQRRGQICELLCEQDALCDELGEPPRALVDDPLPTEEDIKDFCKYLEDLREERMNRFDKLMSLRREIKNYLQILELEVNTAADHRLLNQLDIKLNKEVFIELERMRELYHGQVEEMREYIDSMREKIETLWERLQTPEATRNKIKRYTEYTQRTYDVYREELQRCERERSENVKLYIQQVRAEIKEWWDKCMKSEAERLRFCNFTSNTFTDDLLLLHEMELNDLKKYYETNKQIFELYEERKTLWERMNALEAKASEPGRYNNRGGQLLKEEKERKTIATRLPKIEQHIKELVGQYEQRERRPFLIYGQDVIDVMAKEWQIKREEKEKQSSARKKATTPLCKSQMIPTRTPLSNRNASSAPLRKTPSTKSLSVAPTPTPSTASSRKRKLPAKEATTPQAKRSLMPALNSPSVFAKPNAPNSLQKRTPLQKNRIIATTIRRNSGSHFKKRRSLPKASKRAIQKPKIVISCASDSDPSTEDTYESFQKCISPDSRSSIIQLTTYTCNTSTRPKRLKKINENEHTRNDDTTLIPRMMRTPSKQNLHELPSTSRYTPPSVSNITGSSRKLTTKNLPIII